MRRRSSERARRCRPRRESVPSPSSSGAARASAQSREVYGTLAVCATRSCLLHTRSEKKGAKKEKWPFPGLNRRPAEGVSCLTATLQSVALPTELKSLL